MTKPKKISIVQKKFSIGYEDASIAKPLSFVMNVLAGSRRVRPSDANHTRHLVDVSYRNLSPDLAD